MKPTSSAICLESFSNELRLSILQALKQAPTTVTQLTTSLGAERTRVSHALMDLKKCHLIQAKKEGRNITYSLNAHTPMHEQGDLLKLIDAHVLHNCATCHRCE